MGAPIFRSIHTARTGAAQGTWYPIAGSLDYTFKQNDMGDTGYEIALAHAGLSADAFAPKRSHYRLQISFNDGAGWENVQGGIIDSINLVSDSQAVGVSGKDWLMFLDQPTYFALLDFYSVDMSDLTTGMQELLDNAGDYEEKVWVQEAMTDVITELVEEWTPGLNDPGQGGINFSLSFNGGFGNNVTHIIPFQDETTVLDHIRNLAAMSDPLGFDFYVEWDKTIHFYNPRKNMPPSPSPMYSFNTTEEILAYDWTNNGPLATHVVGLGAGSGNLAPWAIKRDQDSIDSFGYWLMLYRLGDKYRKPEQVDSATQNTQFIFPQKDLKLTCNIEATTTDFFFNQIGNVIDVDYTIVPYHRIDAMFWIIEQHIYADEAGNWLCDFGLEQIYDAP